jgi:Ala-tRNA(Pro) deacylase
MDVLDSEKPVYARLDELSIGYQRYEHPPISTGDEGLVHWEEIEAVHCKNLFLRNQKGSRHYLVVLEVSKRADLRRVADQIGDGKLSFASSERLMTYLSLTPGSVSPFGLIHDRARHVQIFLDRALASAVTISFHPNINTRTITLAYADFLRFLAAEQRPARYLDV